MYKCRRANDKETIDIKDKLASIPIQKNANKKRDDVNILITKHLNIREFIEFKSDFTS